MRLDGEILGLFVKFARVVRKVIAAGRMVLRQDFLVLNLVQQSCAFLPETLKRRRLLGEAEFRRWRV
jgi:hypothetical protein